LHHDQAVDGKEHKPEIISHYNANKGGVDNMDHLAGTYSVKRKSNRWPLVLFFNMMDVAAIAAVRFGCVTAQTGECKNVSVVVASNCKH